MASQQKFKIVQYSNSYSQQLTDCEWGQEFIRIVNTYSGVPCCYPALIVCEDNFVKACGVLVFENKTAWVSGIGASPETEWAFASLEIVSHLTDFANTMMMDNILTLAPEEESAIFDTVGYNKTERLLQFIPPKRLPDSLTNECVVEITEENSSDCLSYIKDVIDEDRKLLFQSPLKGSCVVVDNKIQGVFIANECGAIYAENKEIALQLLHVKHSLDYPSYTVSDDNPQAIALFDDLGFIHVDTTYRLSLGKDNRWKYTNVFSCFSHYCV